MSAKELAKSDPDKILVIAIDGADQQQYALPYFRQMTKDTAKGWKMRTKLIGALVTGRMMMFYTLASNWESGKLSCRVGAPFARQVKWLHPHLRTAGFGDSCRSGMCFSCPLHPPCFGTCCRRVICSPSSTTKSRCTYV